MDTNIFRKSSIEKFSSPEQLDQLMEVTTSKGWIALWTLCGLLASVVVWSVIGQIPTRVQGTGVIIRTGGIYDVTPVASGRLNDLTVQTGEVVTKGQVIATVHRPDLIDEIDRAETQLAELETQHRRLLQFEHKDEVLQFDLLRQQRANHRASIQDVEERITWLSEKLTRQKTLLDDGLITEQMYLTTRQEIQSARQTAARLRSELHQLSIRKLTHQNDREQQLTQSESQIEVLSLKIEQLRNQLVAESEVTSPYAGRVLEVLANPGDVVSRGQAVARIDRAGQTPNELQAVLYIPGTDGKKVYPGMRVHVSPTTVKREEYGSIEAHVDRVSDFPATLASMERVFKNDQLTRVLTAQSAPYEMYATLRLDASTFSGYRWTSSKGPDTRIQGGTMCSATVTVEEHRPIELVMPLLKEFFGI